MDYKKSGTVKPGRNEPRHQERKLSGPPPTPGGRATKAELLARMKAAIEARKRG
jgi:hypothetical protein